MLVTMLLYSFKNKLKVFLFFMQHYIHTYYFIGL